MFFAGWFCALLMGASFSDTIQIPKPSNNWLTGNGNRTKSCSHQYVAQKNFRDLY